MDKAFKRELIKKELIPEKLDKAPTSDHVVNLVKAGLSGIPVIGGPLSSLINDYIPRKKSERLLQFVNVLNGRIEQIQDEINEDLITTEEFGFLFEQTFKLVLENYHEEKLKSLMALLVNSLKQSEYEADKIEYYLKKIETLSPLHLVMIRFLNDPVECFREDGINPENVRTLDFSGTMQTYFKDVPMEILKGVFTDLNQMGFTDTSKSIFGSGTSGRGVQIIRGRLTPLAQDFIKYCSLKISEKKD